MISDEENILVSLDYFGEKLEKKYKGKYSIRIGTGKLEDTGICDVILFINDDYRFSIDGVRFNLGEDFMYKIFPFTPKSSLIEELQRFTDRIEADRDRREVFLEKTSIELEEFVSNF